MANPNPNLTRQHYVIASRLTSSHARKAINDAITKIAVGETYTAADMERKLFPGFENRPGFFNLRNAKYPSSVVQLEMAFDAHDAEVLYEILGLEFDMDAISVEKLSVGHHLAKEKGFGCLMKIFQQYLENVKSKG